MKALPKLDMVVSTAKFKSKCFDEIGLRIAIIRVVSILIITTSFCEILL